MTKYFTTFLFLILVTTDHAYSQEKIVVGGKIFSEQAILGEMMAQLIEDRLHVPVERRFYLGGTQVAFEAIRNGQIDIYTEYTGTALFSILRHDTVTKPHETFVTVQKEFHDRYGLEFLSPFGFDNTWAVAIKKEANTVNIQTLSELTQQDFIMGCIPAFVETPDGLSRLTDSYNCEVPRDRLSVFDAGLMFSAVEKGDVGVIAVCKTDGRIPAFGLETLDDDQHAFPPFEAAPLIRKEVIENYPELPGIINLLSGKITDKEMQVMNWEADGKGVDFAIIANRFLKEKGLISDADIALTPASSKQESLSEYFWSKKKYLFILLKEHLLLTFLAVALSILVGCPLGIILTFYDKTATLTFSFLSTLQTIPSLALLGFMIPILGIGTTPAVLALFFYALLPIVRNTYIGIRDIDPGYHDVSKGIGLTEYQILRYVQIPIALPIIMAGIRTSTVMVIGTATLAALIGAGGLGEPIFQGISSVNVRSILLGAIPAALLAIVIDRVLYCIEARLTSPGLQEGYQK